MSGLLRTQIELKDPKSLKPYKRNNKKHPPAQIKKLMAAIAEHGFDQPIVVDGSLTVIKGHGRLQAALEMKLKQVPVIVAADLTPEQVRAARLADNAIADDAPFDLDAVKFELGELADIGADLKLTGFDELELDRFLADIPTTDYQPPQQFGGYERANSQKDDTPPAPAYRPTPVPQQPTEEPEPEPEPEEAPKGGGINGDRFSLAIVLDQADYRRWKALKERVGERLDKKALLKLMDALEA
jgi:hypothetical protein